LALALAAPASAASVQLQPQSAARAGEALALNVAVAVDEEGDFLSVYQQPAARQTCDQEGEYVAGANGLESRTYEFTYRWPEAGSYRVCAWIFRPGGATAAFQELVVDVAAPPVRLAMTLRGTDPEVDGFELVAALEGEVKGQHTLRAIATRAAACPADFDPGAGVRLRGPGSVGGGFDVELERRLDFGAWRVCAYVDGVSTARAEAVLRKRLRPVAVRQPVIGVIDPGRGLLQCFPGVWTAFPKRTTFAFEWRRGGRTVARGRRFRPRGGAPVRCRVTATNAAGSRRATTPALSP
jgi:hypothetical protein